MAQTKIGTVVSTAMNKTVTVKMVRTLRHPRYQKVISLTKKVKAHSEIPTIQVGDTVEIVACRPLSKTKHFRVVQKIS
ncbi:MAG: 30S ribosomal protein S17 [Candidatus Roizmanbacteria bacterium]